MHCTRSSNALLSFAALPSVRVVQFRMPRGRDRSGANRPGPGEFKGLISGWRGIAIAAGQIARFPPPFKHTGKGRDISLEAQTLRV
eukprot:7924616-Alexandrium_andersonii.AAC.1